MRRLRLIVLLAVTGFAVSVALAPFGSPPVLADDEGAHDDGLRGDVAESDRMADPERGSSGWIEDSYEPDEIVAAALTRAQIEALTRQGYVPLEERMVGGESLVRLSLPRGTGMATALARIRAIAPQAIVDRNHLYRFAATRCTGDRCGPLELLRWPTGPCSAAPVIGLVDTAVDLTHASLRNRRVTLITQRGVGRRSSRPQHGTAVASILVGDPASAVPGLLPNARLITVDAFHHDDGEERMDAFDFVTALDVLGSRGAKVVNLSLAGPDNALVARAVVVADQRGIVLVAATGNDGPSAAPRFPAAYAAVIGVTAVHEDLRVYRHAGRGNHVAFAAPGVEVTAARSEGKGGDRSGPHTGTSFAAPFVSAAAALMGADGRPGARVRVVTALRTRVRDLGATGFDPVFGHGMPQLSGDCDTVSPK